MKIGIITDTHISKDTDKFLYYLKIFFYDVDYIIHAGDFTDKHLIDALKQFKEFTEVFGNVDSVDVKSLLGEKEVIELEDYKIGIYHVHGEDKATIDVLVSY